MERLVITAADIERALLEVRPRAVGARAAKVRPFGAHGVRLRLKPRAPGTDPVELVAIFGGPAPRLFGAKVAEADPDAPGAAPAERGASEGARRDGGSSRGAASPPSKPVDRPFVQKLRAELEGAIVTAIEQPPGERIVLVRFESRSTLALELTGRGASAALLDAAGRVVAAATEKARLAPGEPYAPPVRPKAPAEGADASAIEPSSAAPRPPAFPDVVPDPETFAYGTRLADAGAAAEAAAADAEARAALASSLDRRRRKLEGARGKLEEAMAAGPEGDRFQRLGNLLLANLHRVRRGQAGIEVRDDYAGEDAPAVTIELDPALPPPRQAERLFKRARKLRRGVEVARERLAAVAAELAKVEAAAAALAAGAPPGEAAALAGAPRAVRPPRPKTGRGRAEVAPSGPRRFRSRDGLEILVGRSNEENDRLTLRVAKGNDLFFHVEGFPGAHAIVRASAGKSVPLETMLDAAALAAHYSKARDHGKISVSYTPRKHVRKPRGARPGLVVLDRHQTLHIRPDEERLKRLLASAGPGADAGTDAAADSAAFE